MRIERFTVLAVAALGVVAGCSEAAPPPAELHSAIDDGQLDHNDPAVGYVYQVGTTPEAFCTGSLIAPSWVLSAAHCQQHDEPLGFKLGTSIADFTDYAVDYTLPDLGSDTLLVHLATPINTVYPMHIGRYLPSVGETCLAVGFGHDSADETSPAVKRLGVEKVLALPTSTANYIVVGADPQIADSGDSGGPLVCNGQFIDGKVWRHDDPMLTVHTQEDYTTIPFDWIVQQTGTFACSPRTCSDEGGLCGTTVDDCGGQLTCGSCPSGKQCSGDHCCRTGTDWNGQSCVGPVHCHAGAVDCGGYCCRCTGTTCS